MKSSKMKKNFVHPQVTVIDIETSDLLDASALVTVPDITSGDECPCGCEPKKENCGAGCDPNDPCAFKHW